MTTPVGASSGAAMLDYSVQLDDAPAPAQENDPVPVHEPSGDEAESPSSLLAIAGQVVTYGVVGGLAGAALCKGNIVCVGVGAIVGMGYATYKIDAALDRAEERLQNR